MFVRFIITFVLSCLYCWSTKMPDFPLGKPEIRWLLVLRGIGGTVGVFGFYCEFLSRPMLHIWPLLSAIDSRVATRLPRIPVRRRSHSPWLHLPNPHSLLLLHFPPRTIRQETARRRSNLIPRRRLDSPAWPAGDPPWQPRKHRHA